MVRYIMICYALLHSAHNIIKTAPFCWQLTHSQVSYGFTGWVGVRINSYKYSKPFVCICKHPVCCICHTATHISV